MLGKSRVFVLQFRQAARPRISEQEVAEGTENDSEFSTEANEANEGASRSQTVRQRRGGGYVVHWSRYIVTNVANIGGF